MRIWQVCMDAGIPVGGTKGSSIHVLSTARAFASLGHELVLFCARVADDFQAPEGIRVVCVAEDPRLRKTMKPVAFRQYLNGALDALLRQYADTEGLPTFIYERYSLWSRSAAEFGSRMNVPFLLEVNSPLIDEERTYRSLENEELAVETEEFVFSNSHTVFTVSPPLGEYVRSKCDSCNVECIPNGVDSSWIKDSIESRCGNDVIRIGFVGSLRPWHGLGTLVRATSYLDAKKFKVEIAGNGPMAEDLQWQARDLQVEERLVWHGAVPHADIPKILDGIDIAVAPYPDIYPFYFSPIKLFEYGARGKAVICSKVGYLPSLFSDREVMFAAPDSAERLAEAIYNLASDESHRLSLGRNLRDRIRDNHTWEKIAERIVNTVSNPIRESAGETVG